MLFNTISLLEVVTGAQKLDVGRGKRCAALSKGDDVIEVEFILGSAQGALTAIALPHFDFDLRWYETPALCI
jgi:hypothetical protein